MLHQLAVLEERAVKILEWVVLTERSQDVEDTTVSAALPEG